MIEIRTDADHATLRPLSDQLDASMSDEFKRRLLQLLDDGIRHLVLDLRDVVFLDSTALGVLVAAMRHGGGQAQIAVVGAHPDVLGVFRLTGLDRVFPVFPTVDAARAAFGVRPV